MHPIVSPALFGAHALPTTSAEPHAQAGNHLRAHHHPLLGLPVAPFIVERVAVPNSKHVKVRQSVHFYDARGFELIPPINVTPGNIVTARIAHAPKEICIWAELLADEQKAEPEPRLFRRAAAGDGRAASDESGLRVEAYVSGATGPAFIGRRSKPRFALSGPGLTELRVSGSGTIHGLIWIEAGDADALDGYKPWTVMALPHGGGPRYLGIVNAKDEAFNRVRIQHPLRLPLQESSGAPSPASAPPFTDAEEEMRVISLSETLERDLDSLIADLGTPPLEQAVSSPVIDENGAEVGSSVIRRLHRVNQMQADPGTASNLGYKTLDTEFANSDSELVFYRIHGYFHDFPSKTEGRTAAEFVFDSILSQVPMADRTLSNGQVFVLVSSGVGRTGGFELNKRLSGEFEEHSSYVGIAAIAAADRGAPLDDVDPPAISRLRHLDWLPAVPPDAVRGVEVSVAGVQTGALLAAANRTPAAGSGSFEAINAINPDGWHLPIVLSLSVDPNGLPNQPPGTGFISDRRAGPPSIRYFLCQQDRFGRFSDWTAANAGPGMRPKPPRPDVIAYYKPVPAAQAAASGGPILVHIPVPDNDTLAPGSHPLQKIRVTLRDERFGTVTQVEKDASQKAAVPERANEFRIEISAIGPILDATENRTMRITARWIDTAGAQSVESEPFLLPMKDLRPPPQVIVPNRLQYSARPDVTGLAWIEHRWTPQAGQARYGIYYSDENRLTAHLKSIGQTAVLQALAGAANAAARATIFRANGALFPDHLFERLDGVDRSFASGEKGFRHPVSGSLRVLSMYKIAAESATGAKPKLNGLELIIYGVPNADPPPRPVLALRSVDPEGTEPAFVAEVTISLSPGATKAQNWRLRRTASSAARAGSMPVAAAGLFDPADEAKGKQFAVHRDTGRLDIAAAALLKPWTRYAWVAEAQGAPESGSVEAGTPVPGLWSQASDPVTLIIVPQDGPPAPTVTAIEGAAAAGGITDVIIKLTHPGPLRGGEIGLYKVSLARRLAAGSALVSLREETVSADQSFSLSGIAAPGEVVPEGAEYVITLTDPLGRVSPPATAALELAP